MNVFQPGQLRRLFADSMTPLLSPDSHLTPLLSQGHGTEVLFQEQKFSDAISTNNTFRLARSDTNSLCDWDKQDTPHHANMMVPPDTHQRLPRSLRM